MTAEDIYLANAANTEVPCYLALKALGYQIGREGDEQSERWIATKPGQELLSDDGLCMLLGLAKLVEMRGVAWQASDEEIDAFFQAFPPESGQEPA